MIRKWDIRDEQAKRVCINEIIARVEEQDGTMFGRIAAQEIIDLVAAHLGPQIFNDALDDVKKTVETKLADLEVDIDILKVAR